MFGDEEFAVLLLELFEQGDVLVYLVPVEGHLPGGAHPGALENLTRIGYFANCGPSQRDLVCAEMLVRRSCATFRRTRGDLQKREATPRDRGTQVRFLCTAIEVDGTMEAPLAFSRLRLKAKQPAVWKRLPVRLSDPCLQSGRCQQPQEPVAGDRFKGGDAWYPMGAVYPIVKAGIESP